MKSTHTKNLSVFHVDPYQLDPTGHPPIWKLHFAKLMLVFAIATRIFLVLQIDQLYKTKNSNGLSAASYGVYILSMILWIFYAFTVLKTANWPIVISSVLGLLLAVVILVGIIIFPYQDLTQSTITPTPTSDLTNDS